MKSEILEALSCVIDPDLEENIVDAGFIKDLEISDERDVSFTVELTTPACPIKAEFERQCKEVVSSLEWVESVDVTMTAVQPTAQDNARRPGGLKDVAHVIAVYSCKGGLTVSHVELLRRDISRRWEIDSGCESGLYACTNGRQGWNL